LYDVLSIYGMISERKAAGAVNAYNLIFYQFSRCILLIFQHPKVLNVTISWDGDGGTSFFGNADTSLPDQFSKTNGSQCLYSVYYELTTSTCFEHYLLIFRRCCINNIWYIACILCQLAATRLLPGLEWNSTPTLVAANRHNTHAIYQLFMQHILRVSK
jgi:hypothetical protein